VSPDSRGTVESKYVLVEYRKDCSVCDRPTTFVKLKTNDLPEPDANKRGSLSKDLVDRLYRIQGEKDAFTGSTCKGRLEVDHRVPITHRSYSDSLPEAASDGDIDEEFMLLERNNNLIKRERCASCRKTNKRAGGTLKGDVKFWYEGSEEYKGSCEGCYFSNPEKWTTSLNNLISVSNY